MGLEPLTQAELTAAALLQMARDLTLQAEALLASAPRRKVKASSKGVQFTDPVTGKKTFIEKRTL